MATRTATTIAAITPPEILVSAQNPIHQEHNYTKDKNKKVALF